MPLVEQSESGDRCSFRLRRVGTPATFPGVSDTFKINKEITVVGRNPTSSDIFLDSNKNKVMISRLHARILTDKDETGNQTFRISDTSLNGTYVNDIKIADTCDLNPGDTVTFGHLRGAVLNPGMLAEQPDSEFRFAFEKYPATPPDKKHKNSEQLRSSSPEVQRQTPSPQTVKPGPKTPLFAATGMPGLMTFLTPETPGHVAAYSATDKYTRLPDSTQGKQSWRQHFVSDSSDSEHSDDDLMAYAAAAGGAMEEESDEDIFSVQLPESPESFDETGAPRNSTHVLQTPVSSVTVRPTNQVSKGLKAKGSKATEESKSTANKPSKRPRKSSMKRRRKKVARQCWELESDDVNQQEDDFMYNTCASVDCIHPHNKHKVVDWVQCDDCDDWYHVKCTGLTLKSVRPKAARFHCGCV